MEYGRLEIGAAGALAGGAVRVYDAGRLRTLANGSLDSVIAGGGTVTIDSGGVIEFNSAETGLTTVNPGGGIIHLGSQTYIYSGAGRNIALAAGAILHSSVTNLPTLGELSVGDGGYGVFLGVSGTVSSNYNFGPGGGTIFRGLAVLNQGDTLTYQGAATGQVVAFYAQYGSTITLNQSTRLDVGNPAADAVFLIGSGNSGTFNINGSGTAPLAGNSQTMIITNVGGYVYFNSANVVSGKTINVYNSYVNIAQVSAFAGATINMYNGAVLSFGANPIGGTINFWNGSALIVDGAANLTNGATFNFMEPLSTMALRANIPATNVLPMNGNVNFCLERYVIASIFWDGIVLGNRSRLTAAPNVIEWFGNVKLDVTSGNLRSVGTNALVAAEGGKNLYLNNIVDLPGKTLSVGDTNNFLALSARFSSISQTGTVILANITNVIGQIDVRAGTLYVSTNQHLGGATSVNVRAGATLRLDAATFPLSGTVLTGKGLVMIGDGYYTQQLNFSPTAAAAAEFVPGSAADPGTLTVTGRVSLTTAAGKNVGLRINFAKVQGAVTHGVLAITSTIETPVLAQTDLYLDFARNVRGNDVADKEYTILTTTSDLRAAAFASVHWSDPASGTVIYGNGFVKVTAIFIPARGTMFSIQ